MQNSALHAANAIGLSLLLGCFAAMGVAANVLEKTKLHGWEIRAVSDDKTGAFARCSAVIPYYESNIVLAFYIDNTFDWSMVLGTQM